MRKLVIFLLCAILAIIVIPVFGNCQNGDLAGSNTAKNATYWDQFKQDTDILVLIDKAELGRVLRVWDGDTYTVQLAEKTQFRIFGIDCPETFSGYVKKSQPYGRAATDSVKSWINGKVLKYEIKGSDRYGRTLATLHLGRKDVALLLIEKGLAWVYPDDGNPETPYLSKSQQRRYKSAQRKAQKNKVGLWAEYVDEEGDTVPAIAPWVWRKINSGVSLD